MAIVRKKKVKKHTNKGDGLSAHYILSRTPKYVKARGGYVKLISAKRLKRNQIWRTATRTNILGERPRRHFQEVIVLTDKKIADKARLKVSCDCGFFLYTCEVALFLRGAADIIYSNGEMPVRTNPKKVPLVCKHLYVVLSRLIKSKK